jgi:predicted AAA+ superfamily ATPase
MAFISGPRQTGKTTMAKKMLQTQGNGKYYNWDETEFRRLWTKDPKQTFNFSDTKKTPLVILDELHKAKLWKRSIKGVYDSLETQCNIIVTGSARLNVYRKGGDSLMGRYYHFRLHPFSLAELLKKKVNHNHEDMLEKIFTTTQTNNKNSSTQFSLLDEFGPFPEPLFAASKQILNLWQKGRIEKIIREDLRDLSKLPELSQIEMLTSLLPERVASPLSITSLSEILEVSYTTIKRWLKYLNELYYYFEIKPYSTSISRSLKKTSKIYLWDWSEIQDEAARFENIIASHLLKYCHYMTDTGRGDFKLTYLKNRQNKEIDFLIVKDNQPWLPIEAKLSDTNLSNNWALYLSRLTCKRGIQVVKKQNVHRLVSLEHADVLVISADQLLTYFV